MKKPFIILLAIVLAAPAWAQKQPRIDTIHVADDRMGEALPFKISSDKRLSDEDIENKKEGWYFTGLPEPKIDPIKGYGIGTHINIYNNNTRRDPFFFYTPYRIRYTIGARATTSGQYRLRLAADLPFIFNTPWRLRADVIYEKDPRFQYFGLGSATMQGLSYIDKQTGALVQNAPYSAYAANRALTRMGRAGVAGESPNQVYTDYHYNEVQYRQFIIAPAIERTFMEGRLRVMVGYEMLLTRFETYDGQLASAVDVNTGEAVEVLQGQSKLTEDYQASLRKEPNSYWLRYNISGFTGGRVATFQNALIWDTRDLEPDPSNGVFYEYAQEISHPYLGSQFSFSKHLLQLQNFNKILPRYLGRTVLATRVGFGTVRGKNVPFSEVMDMWHSSRVGGIVVLGGETSLRGYRDYRFAGMVYGWGNAELRTRLFQTNFLKQHLAFSIVPFYDVGRVWDDLDSLEWGQFRGAPGIGARVAWNQATILRFDYAKSREVGQFFFTMEHPF